jgi:hypothetical protein
MAEIYKHVRKTETRENLFIVQNMFHKVSHMSHMFLKLVKHFLPFKFVLIMFQFYRKGDK